MAGEEGILPSAMELERDDISYTIETVRAFSGAGHGELYLLMGLDSLLELHTWRDYEKLLGLCVVVAFQRGNVKDVDVEKTAGRLSTPVTVLDCRGRKAPAEAKRGDVILIRGKRHDVSSTQIRGMVKQGRSLTTRRPYKGPTAWPAERRAGRKQAGG